MSTRKAQQFSRFTFSTILAVLVLLVTLLASAAAPVVSANLKNASIGQLLDSDGTLNTAAGFSGALDLRGWNVTLDSDCGPIFRPAGSLPAGPTANVWSALGTGTNSGVYTIAVSGNIVYVGGGFTSAGDVENTNHIAKWNGSAWSALGMGTNNNVYAIDVNGNDVYVGGDFTSAGGVAPYYIAKWNGSAWSGLGTGTSGWVRAIAVNSNDVYVGGFFNSASGVPANNIAK